MRMKILKILVSILINLCIFISCANTKVIWTDFRSKASEDRIEILFLNEENSSTKSISLTCGKTKFVKIPYDCIPHGFSEPGNLRLNYLIDYENKMIEIFLMDTASYNVENYSAILEEKNNVYAYRIMFVDEQEPNKFCTILSKDNVFKINREDILPTGITKNPTQLLEQVIKSDIGYFYETDDISQIENFQKDYLVKGKFFNHFFWISPDVSGAVSYYIPDESLPEWLKKYL